MIPAPRTRRSLAFVAVAVAVGSASCNASDEPRDAATSPSATSIASIASTVSSGTTGVALAGAPTTGAPATSSTVPSTATTAAAPTTTLAPTTTTTEPPAVECPKPARPIDEVHATLDDVPPKVPTGNANVKRLPRSGLYVNPDSEAARAAARATDAETQDVLTRLAAVPTAFSVGGWLGDRVTEAVAAVTNGAASGGRLAVLQIYNLPYRDAGAGFSAGGSGTADDYRAFTEAVAAGIGANPTIVILEPDSLGQMAALPPPQQLERYLLLNQAIDTYGALPSTWVYLDGTHCGWLPAELNAERLVRAGVNRAQGFFVNVANFQPTAAEVTRARLMSTLTGGMHFVVDTGRNGNGPFLGSLRNAWCNPPDRALGDMPTLDTGSATADAFLWIKQPGASDGTCGRGNPPPGTFWTSTAIEMARNAGW